MADDSEYQDNPFWHNFAMDFHVRPDSIYLNHGSFGQSPWVVRNARRDWIARLDEQPMDFYCRQLENHLYEARKEVGNFVGTTADNLVFVENCTYGMNVVVGSVVLKPGDEVLLNNHEYGAVQRIWDRACTKAGAVKKSIDLPEKFESKQQIVDALISGASEKTKLVVVSHITSPTAIILPVKEICAAFKSRGIPVFIDGPHALVQVPLDIGELDCAFYTASCHKWLCAPLGSGFLYVHPDFQNTIQPPIKSWGRLLPAEPERWDEEFTWMGTRDPSPFLTIPTAIEYLGEIGFEKVRGRMSWLANYAEQKLTEAFETETIAPREQGWYGSMAHIPLPPGDHSNLQQSLWERIGIEVPIVHFENKWYIRVSCHLYNSTRQIDALFTTLLTILGEPRKAVSRG